MVRIATEIASLSLIFESICFLNCIWKDCSPETQAALNGGLGNGFFGVFIQLADNYLTFSRYSVVAGGVTKTHKVCAFVWVFVTMYMTWWEFFTIFPFFFNLNTFRWVLAEYVLNYFVFAAYFAYNLFYLVLFAKFLINAKKRVANLSTNDHVYVDFAAKAAGHTLLSMAGVCLYIFNFPMGIVEQNILTVVGIHVFLNWTTSHKLLRRKQKNQLVMKSVIKPSQPTTKIGSKQEVNGKTILIKSALQKTNE